MSIAKNYLSEFELAQMQRIVSAYLDMAELQAMRRIPMTMQDWETRLNRFIAATDRENVGAFGRLPQHRLDVVVVAELDEVPWIVIRGRKGGSTLVVAAVHALLSLAEARQKAAAA